MNLWLDDVRPAPQGWVWVKTVHDAQKLLSEGRVERASLDHDLGPQPTCYSCKDESQDCGECHCHVRPSNGCDLVAWMVGSGKWPLQKPLVHSANVSGHEHMVKMINNHFPQEQESHQQGNGGQLQETPKTS